MVLVFCTSSHVCNKFNYNPFYTFQEMARTSNKKWPGQATRNGQDKQQEMARTSNKKWPGQATIMGQNCLREITKSIYRVGLWFLCTALPFTAIYLKSKVYINPFCTFQDIAWTGIHYEKKGNREIFNSLHISGRIMVLLHCPSPHCSKFQELGGTKTIPFYLISYISKVVTVLGLYVFNFVFQ